MRFIPNSLTRESRFVTFTRFRRTTKCKVWGCNGIFIRVASSRSCLLAKDGCFCTVTMTSTRRDVEFRICTIYEYKYAIRVQRYQSFKVSTFANFYSIRKTIDGWRRGYVCQNYVSFVRWSISLIETMYQMLFSRFITFIECSASVWLHLSDAL